MQSESRTWLRAARPWLRALEVLGWGAFFACALFVLAARYWLLPNIDDYREEIVGAVSRSLGLKVTVSDLDAGWSGLRPHLNFIDVRVFDREGREALALPAVETLVSWRSLLRGELQLRSLAITGPRLKLRRDAQGAIYVAGVKLAREGGDGRLTDWLLEQNEIVVREAEIDWLDELRAAPPLALAALNFRLHNEGDLHVFAVSARPPRELGSSLEVRGELTGRTVTELGTWNGRVFTELGYTELAGWRAWVDYPLDVRKGQGALRLWASLERGRPTRATADVALTDFAARLGVDLPVLEVASVRGRLFGRDTAQGYEFGVRNLALDAGRGEAMQSSSFRATWQRAAAGREARGSLTADQIELAPLAQLAEYVPLPPEARRLAAELAPRGNVFDVRFDWTGELPHPAAFTAKARFAGLAMNAWAAVPGFSGLSGRIEASDAKGSLQLASTRAQIELPKLFPDPRMGLESLAGEVLWERRAGGGVQVRIQNLNFANDDLAGSAYGTYQTAEAGPGVIDLSAQLMRADGRRTAKYLPRDEILGAATRGWLAGAILDGRASDARLRLKGDLRDFPFADPAKGQFLIVARVREGMLDYANGWPRIEGIDADLRFERDRMEIVGRRARILGASVSNVRVGIPSLLAPASLLTVNGLAEGPTAEFLAYVSQSPVRRMIGGLTDGMRADGRGRLQLRLDLPLDDLSKSRVAGEYRFSGNSVTVDARLPPVERATGRITFTDSGLAVHDVRGQLFGGPVAISGGSGTEAGVAIVARGDATVQGLAPIFDHPWRARLAGGAPYTATVSVQSGKVQVSFESTLRGVTSSLPPPLAKSAADTLPLRVEVFPAADGDRIALGVGNILAADFHRTRKGEAMELQRAGVLLSPAAGSSPRVPDRRGYLIHGSLRALDLDRWLLHLGGDGGDAATSFELRAGTLDILGKRLHDVSVRGVAGRSEWNADVNAAELAGELRYASEGRGRLVARLKRFSIPDDAPGAAPARSGAGETAIGKDLPNVDLLAESFTHRGLNLGRVEVAAQHDGPRWRIDKLSVVNAEGSLQGQGALQTGSAPRTSLGLRVESSDIGRLLERLGHADRITGGKGTLEGKVEWAGEPTAIDFGSLSGKLALQADAGEFPHLDAGLGRLLSLVSLNLSEATAKGYPFDRLAGEFTLARGVAHTENLTVRSSAAEVTMKGDIDLARESQNLHVRVVPTLRRSVTTIATIVNPAVALGMAVGQAVLKDPIGQIFAIEYTVGGSWSEPKVERTGATPPAAGEASQGPGGG